MFVGDFPHGTSARRMEVRTQSIGCRFANELAGLYPLARLDERHTSRTRALLERKHQALEGQITGPKRGGQVVLLDVQFAREGLNRHMAAIAHRMGFYIRGP